MQSHLHGLISAWYATAQQLDLSLQIDILFRFVRLQINFTTFSLSPVRPEFFPEADQGNKSYSFLHVYIILKVQLS